jgi:hypothetical protein
MGADRLKQVKDQAKRGWDKAGLRLIEPIQLSLFDTNPILFPRSFKITLRENAKASLGDVLILQVEENDRFVTRGFETVGDCPNVPTGILDSLKVGGAICLEVIGIGTVTNTVEVAPK